LDVEWGCASQPKLETEQPMADTSHVIVVQHIATSCYFQGRNRWALRIQDAFRFDSVEHAEQFCRQRGPAALRVIARLIPELPSPAAKPVKEPTRNPHPDLTDVPTALRGQNAAPRTRNRHRTTENASLPGKRKDGKFRKPKGQALA
jgi:hypothetical protein